MKSQETPGLEQETPRPFLPWLGQACRQARQQKEIVQDEIAAALKVNQATIARFEDGSAWPRRPEEVLVAYSRQLNIDLRLLWLRAFLLWLEDEPILDEESQEEIRVALKRVLPADDQG
jgi:transcriptional regulator with XRE-family HTH domain